MANIAAAFGEGVGRVRRGAGAGGEAAAAQVCVSAAAQLSGVVPAGGPDVDIGDHRCRPPWSRKSPPGTSRLHAHRLCGGCIRGAERLWCVRSQGGGTKEEGGKNQDSKDGQELKPCAQRCNNCEPGA
eukprot:354254-Chlamydomonas_euryale.AAC.8